MPGAGMPTALITLYPIDADHLGFDALLLQPEA
jgi:hypothetical protein